ncbi:MAG: sigma-70 family RNA polymerase sigma factor [Dehalococcoidia bacterium]|nr:sigma-70 family RNA polymerase sigma factor [Dehalococcoidia bacterium]
MGSHQEYDEAQLIRLIQIGVPEEAEYAFQMLYRSNDPVLRSSLAFRGLQDFEIDEVCATVWDRSLENIEAYVPEGIPYIVWLRRTANYVIKELNRQKQRNQRYTQPLSDDFDVEGHDISTAPLLSLLEEENAEAAEQRRKEIQRVLSQFVEQLPADYQDVIEARLEMGLSPKDTAEILGWDRRKVYDTYYRATRRLRDMLLEYGVTDASWNSDQ